jgi:hypothetical protein
MRQVEEERFVLMPIDEVDGVFGDALGEEGLVGILFGDAVPFVPREGMPWMVGWAGPLSFE